jgi:predicted metal-binding membrane protein
VATYALARERNLILVSLIVLAVAAWGIVLWQADDRDAGSMNMRTPNQQSIAPDARSGGRVSPAANRSTQDMSGGNRDIASDSMADAAEQDMSDDEVAQSGGTGMGLTMNMGVALFLGVWVAMMVAMMFPTAAPMILTFAKIQSARQSKGQVFVPTWLFVLAYLGLWSAMGLLAFAVASFADNLAQDSHWLASNAARIGGGVLVIAGLYQLSPWKNKCLAQCRTPTGFIMTRWREGPFGALRMGLEHGGYCLGCCWLLFAILFPLGMMNVAAMALITLVIFAEKSLAIGERIAKLAAFGLVTYGGVVLIALPSALPTNVTI